MAIKKIKQGVVTEYKSLGHGTCEDLAEENFV